MRILKTIDFYFFSFLTFLVSLPILAPLLSAAGLHSISKYIYFVYSFFCHQFASRSLYIFDWQYAWCARDTGVWLGFLAGAIIYKMGFIKPINFIVLIIFCIPIALDGGIQTLATLISFGSDTLLDEGYHSNNLFRFLTGALFGIGLSLFLTQYILTKRKTAKKYNPYKVMLITLALLSLVYFVLVGLWSMSSTKINPTNALDSVPKVQEGFFFERRKDGECPTDIVTGPLNLECFF